MVLEDLNLIGFCWLKPMEVFVVALLGMTYAEMEVPVPPIDEQLEVVNSYKAIEDRIALKQKINDNLAA